MMTNSSELVAICDYPKCKNCYISKYDITNSDFIDINTPLLLSPTQINYKIPLAYCDYHYKIVIDRLKKGGCIHCLDSFGLAYYGFKNERTPLFCSYHKYNGCYPCLFPNLNR